MHLFNKLRQPFRYSFVNATLILIAVNVGIYFFFNFFTGLKDNIFALSVDGFIFRKMFWQPVTYMFIHGSFSHLLFNMLGLLFFGVVTEKALGSKEFVLMYFVIGILCGLFSVTVYYIAGIHDFSIGNVVRVAQVGSIIYAYPRSYLISLVGASGAIYGILFAYAVIFPRSRIFIWGIIPVPAPILVLVYAIIEFGSQFLSSSNVAHMTHLAGFIFAFLYFLIRMGVNPIKVWRDSYR